MAKNAYRAHIIDSNIQVENVLYLDSDILISPLAPNLFHDFDPLSIAVVSLCNNLPQPRDLTLRRLAFLRHTHLSRSPLDSALFMSLPDVFKYHSLPREMISFVLACLPLISINMHPL